MSHSRHPYFEIKKLRERWRITLAEIADALGVPLAHIAFMTSRNTPIGPYESLLAGMIFGKHIDYFGIRYLRWCITQEKKKIEPEMLEAMRISTLNLRHRLEKKQIIKREIGRAHV